MTDFRSSELERAWAVLGRPRFDEFESFPLEPSFNGHPCRAAVDRAGGRHLLVPAVDQVMIDDRPAVLDLAVRKLVFAGAAGLFLDLSCGEPDLFREFDDVLTDVLSEIRGGERPAATTVRVVARWRKLFRSLLMRGLSHQAKVGLFGELAMLVELVRADPTFPVTDWRGPLGEPHDFETSARCIEVKSLGTSSREIVIHGLAQLDTHDARPLDLLLLRVVEDPDGTTISELVRELEGKVASPGDLRSRLAATGWHPERGTADAEVFSVEGVHRITVGAATPRLVAASLTAPALPPGIGALRYEVEVGALLPHSRLASLVEIAAECLR